MENTLLAGKFISFKSIFGPTKGRKFVDTKILQTLTTPYPILAKIGIRLQCSAIHLHRGCTCPFDLSNVILGLWHTQNCHNITMFCDDAITSNGIDIFRGFKMIHVWKIPSQNKVPCKSKSMTNT